MQNTLSLHATAMIAHGMLSHLTTLSPRARQADYFLTCGSRLAAASQSRLPDGDVALLADATFITD
jgi:hypothetical protein